MVKLMDKKIILSLLVVALIGIVAATYQINNGVDILNPLSNVEIEDTPVTETLEAPAEAATDLNTLAGNDANNNKDKAKAGDTEVENSEPVNATSTAANTSGNDANANTTANASGNNNPSANASGNNNPSANASSTGSGPNVDVQSAGDSGSVTEGQSGSGSDSSNQGSSPQTTVHVQPATGNTPSTTPQTDSQGSSDNNGEISIDAARSLVEQFILEKWAGNKVTLSYGTTVINDYGDKCYIYNMINDNGVTEGQASYNLRNQTIEIMDNSGAGY